MIRTWIGCILIRVGMAIIPANVRELVRNVMLYHFPREAAKAALSAVGL